MKKKGGMSLTTEQILWLILFLLAFALIYLMLKAKILDGIFGNL